MPTPQLGSLNPNATLDELKDYLVGLNRYLNYLLSSLDTLNISRLDAKVIIAGSITALQIAANTITADKMNVTELSAITANMGTLTAGSITTNAEINVGTDATIGNNLNLGESDYTGSKKITWSNDSGISANMSVLSGDMSISVDGFITLTIGSSQGLVVSEKVDAPTFDASVGMNISGEPVATKTYVIGAISGKVDSGSSTSSVSVSDGHNHGFSNTDYIQCYDAVGTPTTKKQWVAYVGSAGHSHTV